MSVEIQSDLIVSKFWKDVRDQLLKEYRSRRGLSGWKLIIRPRTDADNTFTKEPSKFNLTPGEAKQIDEESPDYDFDQEKKVASIIVPDTETLVADGYKLSAVELAEEFADNIESLFDCE